MPRASVAQYGLHLEIFFKSEDPELTPIAGLLVAPEGQAAVERSAVEIDAPCTDAVGDSASAVNIPGLHEARQSERRVIGDFDRLVLGVVARSARDQKSPRVQSSSAASHPRRRSGEHNIHG